MLTDNEIYATLARRIKAGIIDGILYLALIIFLMFVVSQVLKDGGPIRALLIYSPLFFLEPLLVTYLGASIGQHLLGMEVMSINTRKKCPLGISLIRYFTKVLLGSLSLIYMLFSRKHQAIHDHFANTVVLLSRKKIEKNPSFANHGAIEQTYESEYKYPSPLRKFCVFIVWYLLSCILIDVLIETSAILLLPDYSIKTEKLPEGVELIRDFLLSITFITFAIWAAKGRLFGARRKKMKN
ncbi:MAG: RDD family protein [Desulfobacteraceae bacterium]|nr:RDD family protein [Desulfobacteraceae bacterium]